MVMAMPMSVVCCPKPRLEVSPSHHEATCMGMHVEGAGGVSVTLMHGRDESSECELHMSEHLW